MSSAYGRKGLYAVPANPGTINGEFVVSCIPARIAAKYSAATGTLRITSGGYAFSVVPEGSRNSRTIRGR